MTEVKQEYWELCKASSTTLKKMKAKHESLQEKLHNMKIGDKLEFSTEGETLYIEGYTEGKTDSYELEEMVYTRLSPEEAQEKCDQPVVESSMFTTEVCHRCGHSSKLIKKTSLTEGVMGIQEGYWICSNIHCGLLAYHYYRGAGFVV
jgi:hypothetical protein